MHCPGHDHFPLLLHVSMQRCAGDSAGSHAPRLRRANSFDFIPPHRVLAERRADIAGADGEHMNVLFFQFDAGSLADRIEGEFGAAVRRVKWQRDVPRHAGDVDDRSPALLPHYRNHRLHRRDSSEEIRGKHVLAGMHLHLRNGV